MNLDEARKSRTRRVSEKGTAKKGNCARCHSFFFRSFSPSFSFSFFSSFFSFTILPFSSSIHACCRVTLPIQHRARTTTSIAVRICMQVTRDLLPANLEPSDNLRVYASIWLWFGVSGWGKDEKFDYLRLYRNFVAFPNDCGWVGSDDTY